MEPSVNIPLNELQDLLFCSFRYALGRRTYIVGTVANLLIKHINFIEDKDIHTIRREISMAIAENNAGMDMDVQEWMSVLIAIDDRLNKKGE
jgi:endonuclease III-like uncharacterized protein